MIDVIKIDVPTFLRLMELAREEIKNDYDLHDVTQKVVALSQDSVVTMDNYDEIVAFMKKQGNDKPEKNYDELEHIKRLGGVE